MALNIEYIDNQAMQDAAILLERALEAFNVAAGPGTVLNELGIRPVAALYAHLDKYRNAFTDNLDIYKIAAGEIPGDDEIMDALASTFRTKRLGGQIARGSLILQLRNNTTTYINQNYSFYIGDVLLSPIGLHVGIAGSAESNSEALVYTPIISKDNNYYMVISVECNSGDTFAAGTSVQVTGDVSNIQSASVYSPIMGGSLQETNQQLAARLLYGLAPGVLSTPLQLRNSFTEAFGIPPHRVAVYGAQHPAQKRDIDEITGLSLGGRVDVAVADSGGCPIVTVPVTAVRQDSDYTVTMPPELAAGVYDVLSVSGEAGELAHGVAFGVTDSPKHRVPVSAGWASSVQTLTITIPAHQVSGAPDNIAITVTMRRVNDLTALQRHIDSSDRSAPGQDVLVRAPVPCFVEVYAEIAGGNSTAEEYRRRIVDHINNLPVGRGYVTAQDITDALKGTGAYLQYPVSLVGTTVIANKEVVSATADGKISAGISGVAPVIPEETVFFTDMASVRVTSNG